MTDILHIELRWLAQVALCSTLLAMLACVAFRRNAVTRRAFALVAGLLLATLPFALAASSGWVWAVPLPAVAMLSLGGSVAVPAWLAAMVAAVALGLNARAAVGIVASGRQLAALAPIDEPDIVDVARTVARLLDFQRPYRLHYGPDCCSSSLAGNRIVLPRQAGTWRRGALRAVLAHEFVHLARRDDLGLVALRLVLHWYWFLPWVRLLRRQYAEAMEQSCDDRAAECLPSCADYLRGVHCAAVHASSASPSIGAALAGSALADRFRRFLGNRERQLDAGGVYWCLVAVLGTALLCTSVEFEAGEPSAWPYDTVTRRLSLGPQTLGMPMVRERALTDLDRDLRHRGPRPIYPGDALHDGIEGHVVVDFIVAGDGRVVGPRVAASQPAGVFDAAVLRALAERRYEPARPRIAAPNSPSPAARVRFDFRLPTPPQPHP